MRGRQHLGPRPRRACCRSARPGAAPDGLAASAAQSMQSHTVLAASCSSSSPARLEHRLRDRADARACAPSGAGSPAPRAPARWPGSIIASWISTAVGSSLSSTMQRGVPAGLELERVVAEADAEGRDALGEQDVARAARAGGTSGRGPRAARGSPSAKARARLPRRAAACSVTTARSDSGTALRRGSWLRITNFSRSAPERGAARFAQEDPGMVERVERVGLVQEDGVLQVAHHAVEHRRRAPRTPAWCRRRDGWRARGRGRSRARRPSGCRSSAPPRAPRSG